LNVELRDNDRLTLWEGEGEIEQSKKQKREAKETEERVGREVGYTMLCSALLRYDVMSTGGVGSGPGPMVEGVFLECDSVRKTWYLGLLAFFGLSQKVGEGLCSSFGSWNADERDVRACVLPNRGRAGAFPTNPRYL
jgi:hypothetical protein